MRTIGYATYRRNIGHWIQRQLRGEEIRVMRLGKVYAHLLPMRRLRDCQ